MSREQSQIDPIDINREIASNNFENNAMPNDKVRLFMYPIKSLFGNKNKDEILTYSPNVVNVKIIDPDDYQEFTGTIQQNQSYKYGTKQAIASADNEIAVVQNLATNYVTEDYVTYDKKKLYLISENKLETDDDIYFYGKIVQEFNTNQGSNNYDDDDFYDEVPQYNLLVTQDINGWTPKDANDLILRIGKQVDNFELTELEIETPKAFLLEGLKVLARDEDNVLGYADVISKKPIYPLWVNPIEITSSGKMRLLNFWMSDRLLDFETAKKFNGENNYELLKELLLLDKDQIPDKTARIERLKDVKVSFSKMKYKQIRDSALIPPIENEFNEVLSFDFKKDYVSNFILYNKNHEQSSTPPDLIVNSYLWQKAADKSEFRDDALQEFVPLSYIDIEYTIDESIGKSSLINLLMDILSAVYNYENNFKGAGYKNKQTGELNYTALYKQEFEGKNISEYINGLISTWEKSNVKYINSKSYKNFTKILTMISPYIFSDYAIGNNSKDDAKFLLPYYFELLSNPVYKDENNKEIAEKNNGDGIWKYDKLNFKIKSNYYDVEKWTIIHENVANKEIIQEKTDTFIWQNINDNIDESKLPGLKNSDLKSSDINVTKYLVYSNSNLLKKYGNNNKLIMEKKDIKSIIKDCTYNFNIISNKYNPKFIEITGIYGAGIYNLILRSNDSKQITINNIELFNGDKENQGLIKISL